MKGDISDWARNVLGHPLRSAEVLIYSYAEAGPSSIEEIALNFEELGYAKFECDSDGESLMLNDDPMVGTNLGEFGTASARDGRRDPLIENLLGRIVTSIGIVWLRNAPKVAGLQICFSNGGYLTLTNVGDRLMVFDQLPPELLDEFRVEVLQGEFPGEDLQS